MLKASMFNYYVEDNDDFIIFNSKRGLSEAIAVPSSSKDKIISVIDDPNSYTCDSSMVYELKNKGILVDNELDEELLRDYIITQNVTDSKLQLLIETTTVCNFRCKYCSADFHESVSMPINVQNRIIEFVRKKITSVTSVQINWFGGEPLVAIDVIENISWQVQEICKKAHKKYTATITTNGYLLTVDNINRLLNCNVFSYTVTIDGLMNVHDGLRVLPNGGPTYDVIMTNLISIRDQVQCKLLNIVIRTNLVKKSLMEVETFLMLLNREFGQDARFSHMFCIAQDWGGERVEEIKSQLLTIRDFNTVFDRISKLNIKYSCRYNWSALSIGGLCCRSSYLNRYCFSTQGLVTKCENTKEQYQVGMINDKGELHLDYEKEAAWMFGLRKRNRDNCNTCPLSLLCFMSRCTKEYFISTENRCTIHGEVDALLKAANRLGMIIHIVQ